MPDIKAAGSVNLNEWFERNVNKKSAGAKSDLGIDDFLQLMAAQMRNQDMMNPLSESEFMGQLAQFSALQAMTNLAALNATTYSVSLLGKEVTVARLVNGRLITETGVVTGIGLFDGDPIIYIGEKHYYLGEIMVVGKMPESKDEGKESEPESGESEVVDKTEEV